MPTSAMNSSSSSSSGPGPRHRLHRTKSTSSTQTTTSTSLTTGHYRTTTSIDPITTTTRQHAEAAALEAFQRAHRMHEDPRLAHGGRSPAVPLKSKRRGGGGGEGGRAEGRYFEDARLGRRLSASKKDRGSKGGDGGMRGFMRHRRSLGLVKREVKEEETWKMGRSMPVVSSPPVAQAALRHGATEWSDGSPVAFERAGVQTTRSSPYLADPWTENLDVGSYEPVVGVATVDEQFHGEAPGVQAYRSSPSAPPPPRDELAVARARDKCLQDFQQKRLRERKSFIAETFQKLRPSIHQKNTPGTGFDTSLPPFNYADAGFSPPQIPSSSPPPDVAAIPVFETRRSRNFSDTLKGRLKQVFRRTSRVATEIPAQHVEAKQLHYPISAPQYIPDHRGVSKDEDPFVTSTSDHPSQSASSATSRIESTNSRISDDAASTAKSRVTSWTNSTTIGTSSTAGRTTQCGSTDENGRLHRSDSMSTLRRAGSFFGRPLKNRLRRSSTADLRGSDASSGLFSALQDRLQPAAVAVAGMETGGQSFEKDEEGGKDLEFALSTLPSQLRSARSPLSAKPYWTAPTIRSVTPDTTVRPHDSLSPVVEVLSPQNTFYKDQSNLDITPKSRLQRRHAIKAPTPSEKQIAQRMEKARNRWQAPLDDRSPPPSMPNRADTVIDNPYELRSLNRTIPAHHHHDPSQKIDQLDSQPRAVLSPSIYSRESDGVSPPLRADSPSERGSITVTITGREVRSYPITPRSRRDEIVDRTARNSREWRRWLSDELKDWNATAASLTFPRGALNERDYSPPTSTGLERLENRRTERGRPGSASPAMNLALLEVEPQRPGGTSPAMEGSLLEVKSQRPRSRASYMNERYPIIPTDSNTSDHAGRQRNSSSRTCNPGDWSTPAKLLSGHPKAREENLRPESRDSERHVVSKRSIIFNGISANRASSGLDSRDVRAPITINNMTTTHSALTNHNPSHDPPKPTTSRARSAFDLRANYKSGRASPAKPLEVRRKPIATTAVSLLDDTTIRKISAGPYASDNSPGSIFGPANANKENTSPPDPTSLTCVSSSEWLFASKPAKKSDERKTSAGRMGLRDRDAMRNSPARPCSGLGERSPGQRLVTGWLDSKKVGGSSPGAFV